MNAHARSVNMALTYAVLYENSQNELHFNEKDIKRDNMSTHFFFHLV